MNKQKTEKSTESAMYDTANVILEALVQKNETT